MSKRGFGPKFSSSTVSANYEHDDLIAKDLRDQAIRMAGIMKAAPRHKKELWAHNAANKNRSRKDQRLAARQDRDDAELRMIEAVRKAVETLEFHMTAMMDHDGRGAAKVNQLAIYNGIVHFKTKCGIKFDDVGFTRRVALDPPSTKAPVLHVEDDDLHERMERQRSQRDARFRRVTDRLIARSKP